MNPSDAFHIELEQDEEFSLQPTMGSQETSRALRRLRKAAPALEVGCARSNSFHDEIEAKQPQDEDTQVVDAEGNANANTTGLSVTVHTSKSAANDGEDPNLNEKAPTPSEWVQCDECSKWRKLGPEITAAGLPDEWQCKMSTWDPERANCDAPQELGYDSEEDEDEVNPVDEEEEEEEAAGQTRHLNAEHLYDSDEDEEEVLEQMAKDGTLGTQFEAQVEEYDEEGEEEGEFHDAHAAPTGTEEVKDYRKMTAKEKQLAKLAIKNEAKKREMAREMLEIEQQRLMRDSARSARFEHKGDDEENRKPLTGVLAKLNMLKSKLAPAPEAKPKLRFSMADFEADLTTSASASGAQAPEVLVLIEDEEPEKGSKSPLATAIDPEPELPPTRNAPPGLLTDTLDDTMMDDEDGEAALEQAQDTEATEGPTEAASQGMSLGLEASQFPPCPDTETTAVLDEPAPLHDNRQCPTTSTTAVNTVQDYEIDAGSDADKADGTDADEPEDPESASEAAAAAARVPEEAAKEGERAEYEFDAESFKAHAERKQREHMMRAKLAGFVEQEAEMSGEEGHSSEDEEDMEDDPELQDFIARGQDLAALEEMDEGERAAFHANWLVQQDKLQERAALRGYKSGWRRKRKDPNTGRVGNLLGATDADLDSDEEEAFRERIRQRRELDRELNGGLSDLEIDMDTPADDSAPIVDSDGEDITEATKHMREAREDYNRRKLLEEAPMKSLLQPNQGASNSAVMGLIHRANSSLLSESQELSRKGKENTSKKTASNVATKKTFGMFHQKAGALSFLGRRDNSNTGVVKQLSTNATVASRAFVFGGEGSNSGWGFDTHSQQGPTDPAAHDNSGTSNSRGNGITLSGGFKAAGLPGSTKSNAAPGNAGGARLFGLLKRPEPSTSSKPGAFSDGTLKSIPSMRVA